MACFINLFKHGGDPVKAVLYWKNERSPVQLLWTWEIQGGQHMICVKKN